MISKNWSKLEKMTKNLAEIDKNWERNRHKSGEKSWQKSEKMTKIYFFWKNWQKSSKIVKRGNEIDKILKKSW